MAKIIGIAGTAKNTGKTTTTMAIMERAYRENMQLGLTSIGYDGEDLDNVTGLPKPRIMAEKGTMVAIAQNCLKACSAKIEVLAVTEIQTALGKIVMGVVREPGLVLVAGPNKSSELQMVNNGLEELGCELILVDGALNRIAPMVQTQGLIMATGAARTTDSKKLALETNSLEEILNLPLWEGGGHSFMTIHSLLTEDMVRDFLTRITPDVGEIFITGIIGENSFQTLLNLGGEGLKGKTLVMTDPIKILVAGAPDKMQGIINTLKGQGIEIKVKKNINLLAVTINPFYPRYRFASHDYEPAYVDREFLKKVLAEKAGVPVVNVVNDGIDPLWQRIVSLPIS